MAIRRQKLSRFVIIKNSPLFLLIDSGHTSWGQRYWQWIISASGTHNTPRSKASNSSTLKLITLNALLNFSITGHSWPNSSLEFLGWYHSFVFKWGEIGICFSFLINLNKKLIYGYSGVKNHFWNGVLYVSAFKTLLHIRVTLRGWKILMSDLTPRKSNLIGLGCEKAWGILKAKLVTLICTKIWESMFFIILFIICSWS